MDKAAEKVSGYEIGKEYRTVTVGSLLSMMMYATGILVAVLLILSFFGPHAAEIPASARISISVFAAVVLGGAIALNIFMHRAPNAKYTVLNTYKGEDGYYTADLLFSDGTRMTRNVGSGYGFWTDFGLMMKETFKGK